MAESILGALPDAPTMGAAHDEPPVDTDDGGAIVSVAQDREVEEEGEFYRNIADDLDQNDLDKLCTELVQKIEYDRESRKKRDRQYEEGLRRTGLGEDAPGGAAFQGV